MSTDLSFPFPAVKAYCLELDQQAVEIVALSEKNMAIKMPDTPLKRLHFRIDLGELGIHTVKTRTNTTAGGGDLLRVDLVQPSYRFLRAATEYLIGHSESVTPQSLRDSRLPLNGLETVIKITETHDTENIRPILELRHFAALQEGRVAADASIESLQDDYDQYSKHILLWINRKLVGSMRVVYLQGQRHRSELEQYIHLPEHYFSTNSVEISRFVVHPDYRGGDVFIQLMRNVVRIALQDRADYLLVDCRGFLLKVYKRLGAVDTGLTIDLPLFPGEPMHVIYFEASRAQRFFFGNFGYWVKVLLPLYRDLVKNGTVQPTAIFRSKLALGTLAESGLRMADVIKWHVGR